MSYNLPSELRSWLISLGFSHKDISTEQIEEEFRRLTPPEVRDIWRSILVHVVPVQESSYVKKVLLLKELEKYASSSRKKPLIPSNFKSIHELRQFKNREKVLKQLDNYRSSINDVNARIEETQKKIAELGKKQEHLKKERENVDTVLTLEKLKITSYERLINKLNESHECLSFAGSFWNSADRKSSADAQSVTQETMKACLRKVNEFGKRRQLMNPSSLITHQQILVRDIVDLTCNLLPADIQKALISMLYDTLSSVLKMSDHVGAKQENENGNFEKKLTELQKQSVQSFLNSRIVQSGLKNLQENVQTQQAQLLSLLEKNFKGTLNKKDLEQWMETEFLKHRMMTRQRYLARKEEMFKNSSTTQTCLDFKNENDKETFFKNIHEYQNQLVVLDREMANNLCYLSNESIQTFITFQRDCERKLSRFTEDGNSSKKLDFAAKLADSFKNEIGLLTALYLESSSRNTLIFNTDVSHITAQQDNVIEYTKKYNFLVYLNNVCDEFLQKVHRPCLNSDTLDQKRIKITNEEEEFVSRLRKSLEEAKSNLDLAETYAETCAKHIELWSDFSVNNLIPKKMIVADHTFFEWQERYYTIIHRLLKK